MPLVRPVRTEYLGEAPEHFASYVQGDDYVLGKASAPGQASAVTLTKDSTKDGDTTCTGNVAVTTVKVDTGVTAGSRGVIALQGKPTVPVPDGFEDSRHAEEWSDPATESHITEMYVRVPTPVREFIVGTGALPTQTRRAIADTGACRSAMSVRCTSTATRASTT